MLAFEWQLQEMGVSVLFGGVSHGLRFRSEA